MVGAHDPEVAAVERRDLLDTTAFRCSDHRGVHAAERQVVIAADELGDPDQVGRIDGLKREAAGGQVSEEPNLRLPPQSGSEQIDDLGDDECRDEQWALVGLQQFPARRVVGIVAVDVRVERT